MPNAVLVSTVSTPCQRLNGVDVGSMAVPYPVLVTARKSLRVDPSV